MLSLIPYPPGDNDPENTQRIRITHFFYILLLGPPPKHLGDNGVWEEGVGGHGQALGDNNGLGGVKKWILGSQKVL